MFGQTSSNIIKNPFGSTSKFQFGDQTSTPLRGASTGSSSSSTGFAAFTLSSVQTSGSFGEFVATTQSAPRDNTQFVFGTSTKPAFGTSTIPAFGKTLGVSSSSFGAQSTSQSIGNTVSAGSQPQGSRVAAYKSTLAHQEVGGEFRLHSITAMPVYESKSLEELRFEDYELGDKGGKTTIKASTPWNTIPSFPFPQTSSSSTPTPTPPFSSISQPFSNPFKTSHTTPRPSRFPSRTSRTSQTSSSPSTSVVSSTPTTSLFRPPTSTPPFSSISQPFPNPFNTSNVTPPFSFPSLTSSQTTQASSSSSSSSPSTVSSIPANNLFKITPTPTPSLFPNTQSFSNSSNTSNVTSPPFSFPSWTSTQVTSPIPPATDTFTRPTPSIPSTQTSISTPAQSLFSTPGSNIITPSQPQVPRPSNTPILQQNDLVQQQQQQQQQQHQQQQQQQEQEQQLLLPQQQQQQQQVLVVPATNPFGTPRAMPQGSNGSTVQYGISSMPVVDRPACASVRVSSLSAVKDQIRRHSIGFLAAGCKSRRYDPYKLKNGTSHPKVPFFSDDADQVPRTPNIRL